jgi:hypothetical protein
LAIVSPLALALRDTTLPSSPSPVSLALAHPAGSSVAAFEEHRAALGAQAFGEPHGLREIDELVRDPDARGFVVVQASGGVLDAVTRHVERRARALGRPLVKIDGLPTDDPWRELVARFQSTAQASARGADALTAAQAVIDRAGPALVLVREGAGTSFGRALAAELSRLAAEGTARALIVVLAEAAPPVSRGDRLAGRVVDVEAEVSSDDL